MVIVMETQTAPLHVGHEFVWQYYSMLNEEPQQLHRFYNSNSSFIQTEEDHPEISDASDLVADHNVSPFFEQQPVTDGTAHIDEIAVVTEIAASATIRQASSPVLTEVYSIQDIEKPPILSDYIDARFLDDSLTNLKIDYEPQNNCFRQDDTSTVYNNTPDNIPSMNYAPHVPDSTDNSGTFVIQDPEITNCTSEKSGFGITNDTPNISDTDSDTYSDTDIYRTGICALSESFDQGLAPSDHTWSPPYFRQGILSKLQLYMSSHDAMHSRQHSWSRLSAFSGNHYRPF